MPVVFAGQCAQNIFDDVLKGEAGFNIGIAVTLTALMISIAYMIGTTTNNANLVVFSKDELYHLLFSAMIILGITGILFFSCQALTGFLDFVLGPSGLDLMTEEGCYTGNEAPAQIATCYLKDVKKSTEGITRRMIKESIANEMASTLVISVYNPVTGGVSIPWNAYRKAFGMQFDMIAMNFALPALVSINLQMFVLSFSEDLLVWMLPVALLLRVVGPTRNFGNILIAIAIALYVIVPTLYALNGAMDQVAIRQCSQYSAMLDGSLIDSSDELTGGCDSDMSMWLVARALPQAFFLPNLTLALVITFLGGITKALKVVG